MSPQSIFFFFIPQRALVGIIGSYGAENGIPREITLGCCHTAGNLTSHLI